MGLGTFSPHGEKEAYWNHTFIGKIGPPPWVESPQVGEESLTRGSSSPGGILVSKREAIVVKGMKSDTA